MLWLYIHFPYLQMDLTHKLKGKPGKAFVIIDKNLNEVVQLNTAAREAGIEKGMGLASSISLTCDLDVTDYSALYEETKLKEIAEHLYFTTSDISLDPPQGLFIKVSPMLKLYSDVNSYWQLVKQQLLSFNITTHYAISHSAESARLLAQSSINKIFTDKQACLELLRQLPVNALLIGDKTKKSLYSVGIKSLGQLLDVPLAELAIRFDIQLINYIGQLTGELKEKLSYYQPKTQFYTTLELLFEIDNTSILIKPLTKLLNELESFLTVRCLTTQKLTFNFKQANQEHFVLTLASAKAQYQATAWLTLLTLKLEKVTLRSAIRAISLSATQLENQQATTRDLYSRKQNELSKEELLSVLQTKLGIDCVHVPIYKPEHLAEHNTLLQRPDIKLKHSPVSQVSDGLRPAHILPAPIPLCESVEIKQSAERIQTQWWQSDIKRDYFLATNHNQQLMWIFRQPDNKWFIHGYFG
ncbi:MAG: DNA polymerase Y family protein [Gammaproteobacteria bacterium]|nr:DNA polymerase Y family protein [Gammaproteobacteria bacterium]